jgi:hypothetical protein
MKADHRSPRMLQVALTSGCTLTRTVRAIVLFPD